MDALTTKEMALTSMILALGGELEEGKWGDSEVYRMEMEKVHREAKVLLAELDELLLQRASKQKRRRGGGGGDGRRGENRGAEDLEAHQIELGRLRRLLLESLLKVKDNIRRKEESQRVELLSLATTQLRRRRASGRGETSDTETGRRDEEAETDPMPDKMGASQQIRIAQSVSESLRRSRDLLREEMERGGEMSKVLSSSSSIIEKSLGEHSQLGSSTHLSQQYLNKLKRRELTDKILLGLGTCFFFLVVIYVILTRLGLIPSQRS